MYPEMKISMDGRDRAKDNIWIEIFWKTARTCLNNGNSIEGTTGSGISAIRQNHATKRIYASYTNGVWYGGRRTNMERSRIIVLYSPNK